MSTTNTEQLSELAQSLYGIHMDKLMTPLSEAQPSGPYLKYEDVYFNIQKARTADDSSLPMGVWDHELKKAEWGRVIELCSSTLNQKSKDIQLAVWILEAGIHRFGFSGLAPALYIIYSLCENFWADVHPQIENDDLEYRINPIVWANDKLLPALRLAPIFPSPEREGDYCWVDWLQASKYSDTFNKKDPNVATQEQLKSALKRVDSSVLQDLSKKIQDAMFMSERLVALLDGYCMEYAPSLGHIQNLLVDVSSFLEEELRCRGLFTSEAPENEHSSVLSAGSVSDIDSQAPSKGEEESSKGIIYGRNRTYEDVEKAAQILLKIDPHSPAPYLILQACRWGTMDTRELYKELFVECGGQLNIFELLGVDSSAMAASNSAQ